MTAAVPDSAGVDLPPHATPSHLIAMLTVRGRLKQGIQIPVLELGKVWKAATQPESFFTQEEWVEAFRAAPDVPEYTEPMTLYRGAHRSELSTGSYHMSWTPEIDVAYMYALMRGEMKRGKRPDRIVLKAAVPPDRIVFDTYRLGPVEKEIIVDPRGLEGVQAVDPFFNDAERVAAAIRLNNSIVEFTHAARKGQ